MSDGLVPDLGRAQALARAKPSELESLIRSTGFCRAKARNLLAMARQVAERHGGRIPSDLESLTALGGVGRKTANIVVTIAFRKHGIAVDTHVHRIANRLGYVRTKTADDTEMALRRKLPKRYWIVLNDLLVAYGQNLCKPISPLCSRCKIAEYCRRVGVSISR